MCYQQFWLKCLNLRIKQEEQLKKRYMSAQVLNKDRKRQEIAQAKEENLTKVHFKFLNTIKLKYKIGN